MRDEPPTTAGSGVAATRPAPAARRSLSVTGHKFFILFLFLLAELILFPYLGNSQGTRYYFVRALGIIVSLVTVYAISFRRSIIFIAMFLAIPTMVEHSAFLRAKIGSVSTVNVILSFVFDVFVIVIIFRRVYARDNPTAETIFGAVCIYLLIGFTFARLYAILAAVQPHAFYLDPAVNHQSTPAVFDFIYFSFGSMTTAGSSGIAAVSPQVRSLSIIESILGVLYLAVMISRLMDAYRPGDPRAGNS